MGAGRWVTRDGGRQRRWVTRERETGGWARGEGGKGWRQAGGLLGRGRLEDGPEGRGGGGGGARMEAGRWVTRDGGRQRRWVTRDGGRQRRWVTRDGGRQVGY